MDELPQIFDYPGKKTRSRVRGFFGFYRKSNNGPPVKENLEMSRVVCKLCRKEYAYKGNTTNLQFHLEHDHRNLGGEEPARQQSPKPQPKISMHFVREKEARLSATKQQELDDSLMKLIVGKSLPFSTVDCEYFREFANGLDPRYSVPSRKTFVGLLERKHGLMQKQLKKDLLTCQDVAITHDGWTSINTESYGTVTGHFIDSKWDLKSVVIQTRKMEGSHTAENIADALSEMQKNWIPHLEPVATTDNAANEKKAIALLEWARFGCYGHRVNLVVRKALEVPEVARLVGKGRKLVSYFHHSSSVTDLLLLKQKLVLGGDAVGHKLIQDVATRWNRTYNMLCRLLEQTPAILAVITDPGPSQAAATALKPLAFTFEEQVIIERLTDILSPYCKATEMVCADQTPTMQSIKPMLMKLKKCNIMLDDDPPAIRKVKTVMQQQLDQRVDDSDSEFVSLALVLNPFTKSLPPGEREDVRHMLLSKVRDRVHGLRPAVKQEPEENHDPDLDPPSDKKPSIEDLIPECTQPTKKRKLSVSNDDWLSDIIFVGESRVDDFDVAKSEVDQYLTCPVHSEEVTILEWWKQNETMYPNISVLAKKYLAVPSSSVSSERVFSLTGHLINKKRARMDSDNVDMLVFMNKNMKHYW